MTWQALAAPPNELGESPFWHPDEKRLYWVDIPAKQIFRCDVASGQTENWAMPSEPGCIAPARTNRQSSGLIIALRGGIYRARQWGGELERLLPAPKLVLRGCSTRWLRSQRTVFFLHRPRDQTTGLAGARCAPLTLENL